MLPAEVLTGPAVSQLDGTFHEGPLHGPEQQAGRVALGWCSEGKTLPSNVA